MWDERSLQTGFQALYIHIPFCRRKCAYCDFCSWDIGSCKQSYGEAALKLMETYVEGIESELERLAQLGLLESCKTAYIGGGTPSYLGELLPHLVSAVRRVCPHLIEFSCEANPDSLSYDLACDLKAAGLTRMSIGVQSTDDDELTALGRIHSATQAVAALEAAVQAGLQTSADLMCAIPHQSAISWKRSLETVLSTGIQHISIYPLQIEEGTALALKLKGHEPSWNDPNIQAQRMEEAESILTLNDFKRYEVASYAQHGALCRHNQAYWTGKSYIGLGPSAASMCSASTYKILQEHYPKLPRLDNDVARIRMRIVPQERCSSIPQSDPLSFYKGSVELEYLDLAQVCAEDLMLGMRLSSGIGNELLKYAKQYLGEDRITSCLQSLEQRKLIQWNGDTNSWQPTHAGWLLGNDIFSAFWDLAPEQTTRTQEVTLA